MENKISVVQVLQEGFGIGLKNAASIVGAVVLWLITIWIPYLNVGTTIAISTVPIELSKGGIISPTFIFDAKYRQYMGEYFALYGLMALSLIPAFYFLIVPGIVISIGWSLALYILLDKGVAPGEAMIQSNKATNGYKWTIFLIGLVKVITLLILIWLVFQICDSGFFMFLLLLIVTAVYKSFSIGCDTVIYRNLTKEKVQKESVSDF